MSARIGIVIVVIAAIVASFTVFVVSERERAILFQLGKESCATTTSPDSHFKVPFFQDVQKFDARIQTLDAAAELYLTKEKKNVKVDSYVKWRISDVNRYFTATGGSARRGASRLHAVNQTDLKDAFGRRTIPEVVAEDRAEIMRELTISLNERARGLGMEVIDVRIKRIDLEDSVSNSVYQRMAAERTEVAKDRRSRGEEEAKKIRAVAEREREVLIAEATREAERTRGEGDGTATGDLRQGPHAGPRSSTASTAASTPIRRPSAANRTCCCCSPTRTSSTSSRTRGAAASAEVAVSPTSGATARPAFVSESAPAAGSR